MSQSAQTFIQSNRYYALIGHYLLSPEAGGRPDVWQRKTEKKKLPKYKLSLIF